MRTAATVAATIAAVAAAAVSALPADARPIENAHFTNEFVDGANKFSVSEIQAKAKAWK